MEHLKVSVSAPGGLLNWPSLCVCCNERANHTLKVVVYSNTNTGFLGNKTTTNTFFNVPYCRACARHDNRLPPFYAVVDMLGSLPVLVCAITGLVFVFLAVANFKERFFDDFLKDVIIVPILIGLTVFFLRLNRAINNKQFERQSDAQIKKVTPRCSVAKMADGVTYAVNGEANFNGKYTFSFTNHHYAKLFIEANRGAELTNNRL